MGSKGRRSGFGRYNISSTNEMKRKTPERCGHCDREFSDSLLSTKRFISKSIELGNEEEVVSISDAIKRIFEWKVNRKRRYKIERSLQVCHECGLCIGKLYGTIQMFDYLKKPNSYIHNAILKDQADEMLMRGEESPRGKIGEVGSVLPHPLPHGTPDDEDMAGDRIHFDDFVMTEEISYEDEEFKGEVKGREGVGVVVLGVDDMPPSPRAAGAPMVDLENKTYLCQLCPKGFTTNQGLRTHLLLTHEVGNKTKEHVCVHCGKRYFYEYLLRNHEKVHSDEKPVTCPICPSRFKTKLALVHHKKNVHEAEDRPFKCGHCPKSYKEARSLREHVNITHNASGPTFKCKFGCGSMTSRKRSMLSHYRRCRDRPGGVGETEAAVRRIGGRVRKVPMKKARRGKVDGNGRIPCKWDCGRYFKDKRAAMRHNVYSCTQRPEKRLPLTELKREPEEEPKTEPEDGIPYDEENEETLFPPPISSDVSDRDTDNQGPSLALVQ